MFTSKEFQEFLTRNGIHHVRSAPYHPSSNGQAERAVQIFKKGMKRSTSDSLETRVSRFLFHYRTTPNTTTGHTPAELMMGRQLCSHLTLVRPSIAMQVSANQQRQKDDHDRGSRGKHFKEGDPVYVRDFPAGKSWLPGQVKEVQGQSSVVVELDDSRVVRRHVDHARYRVESSPSREDDARSRVESSPSREDDDGWETVEVASDTTQQDIDDVDQSQQEDRSVQGTQPPTGQLRRSNRNRTQRQFFDPSSYH